MLINTEKIIDMYVEPCTEPLFRGQKSILTVEGLSIYGSQVVLNYDTDKKVILCRDRSKKVCNLVHIEYSYLIDNSCRDIGISEFSDEDVEWFTSNRKAFLAEKKLLFSNLKNKESEGITKLYNKYKEELKSYISSRKL